jgi:hypothetical protein
LESSVEGVRELSAADDGGAVTDPQLSGYRIRLGRVSSVGVLEVVGAIIAPISVIAALLYYLGWARTHAVFVYFGIDTQLIDYGPADYILRSSSALFDSLIRVVFSALVLVGFHRFVVRRALDMPGQWRVQRAISRLGVVAHVVGVALAIVVIIGVLAPGKVGRNLGIFAPVLLVSSVLLLGYAPYLRSASQRSLVHSGQDVPAIAAEGRGAESADDHDVLANQRHVGERRRGKRLIDMLKNLYSGWFSSPADLRSPIRVFLLFTLGLIGLLWAASLYAYRSGVESAIHLVDELPSIA